MTESSAYPTTVSLLGVPIEVGASQKGAPKKATLRGTLRKYPPPPRSPAGEASSPLPRPWCPGPGPPSLGSAITADLSRITLHPLSCCALLQALTV